MARLPGEYAVGDARLDPPPDDEPVCPHGARQNGPCAACEHERSLDATEPDNTAPLWQLTQARREVLEAIEAQDGELSPELEARWKALDGAILGRVDDVGRAIAVLEAEAEMFDDRAAAHQKRVAARLRMIDRLKEALRDAMTAAGQRAIAGEEFTARLKQSAGAVVVDDARRLPVEFLRAVDPVPNKDALAKALKDGRAIPGVAIVRKPYVVIS